MRKNPPGKYKTHKTKAVKTRASEHFNFLLLAFAY